ncbi:hypothetical protein HNY73_014967 [Argiope bruennichi]|uniref:Uncharacterized protein n=1 Tax=Argiope bruennichi TaxID=94029 RepID=A0A8T0EV97_ARGBR|nr:hypothetical protein HNY73_014967 [Argiope bruennichi]
MPPTIIHLTTTEKPKETKKREGASPKKHMCDRNHISPRPQAATHNPPNHPSCQAEIYYQGIGPCPARTPPLVPTRFPLPLHCASTPTLYTPSPPLPPTTVTNIDSNHTIIPQSRTSTPLLKPPTLSYAPPIPIPPMIPPNPPHTPRTQSNPIARTHYSLPSSRYAPPPPPPLHPSGPTPLRTTNPSPRASNTHTLTPQNNEAPKISTKRSDQSHHHKSTSHPTTTPTPTPPPSDCWNL